jgi:O-methyltransferase
MTADLLEVTLVSADRLHVLYTLARQAALMPGEFWECGVFQGGTAMLFSRILALHAPVGTRLRLFDTFEGMPETDPRRDRHRKGDFKQTNLAAVKSRLTEPFVSFHPGFIPSTFAGLDHVQLSLVHVDLDIYRSYRDCLEFVYPRMIPGGFIICDDYGFPSCPGARQGTDEFFAHLPERPLVLATGQAVIVKMPNAQKATTA